MIDELIEEGADEGAREVVLGMAHRGRLNVLAHTVGRPYEAIIAEFEGEQSMDVDTAMPEGGTGDVKYHYGAAGTYRTKAGKGVTVTLSPNPSHLEFINPVVEGRARADQTSRKARDPVHEPSSVVPVLLHGDAAFPGQGVVAETLNLQALSGYSTGGTIHIIMNNQLGFTTDPNDARSTRYASDLAKGYDVPVIHVNADDVEACIHAVRLAMGFRREFRRDAVIDLIGYRRFGHNETDEPGVHAAADVRQDQEAPAGAEDLRAEADRRGARHRGGGRRRSPPRPTRSSPTRTPSCAQAMTQGPDTGEFEIDTGPSKEPRTAVPAETLRSLNEQLLRVPSGFSVHRKLKPQLERRRETHRRGGRDRLGAGGGARVRIAARAGHADPPDRPGHRARHVQPAPPVAARHEDRREVHADPEPEERDRAVRAAQQPAVGDRVPRLRVRLLGPGARGARALGGAVRRLRERRAGRDRPVPRLRPRQVGPDLAASRCSCRTATRARGPSTRAGASSASCSSLPRATSGSPTSRRPRQYFHLLRRQALVQKARPLVVMTPKSLLRLPAAASHVDELADGGLQVVIDDPDLPGLARGHHEARPLHRQGLLRHRRPRGARRRRSTSRSRASSCSTRSPRTSCAR